MLDDLKTAIRSLRHSASVTIVTVAVLTLGIGATTAIFSVVDTVVLRSLPFDDQDRLVAIGERQAPGPTTAPDTDPDEIRAASPQNYLDWAARQHVFDSIAAIASGAVTLRESGAEPEDLPAQRVTSAFFDVLRVRPALGRAFTAENETEGGHRVAVLSNALWRTRFGGDPNIVGRTIRFDDGAYEVAGVMPPDLVFPVGALRPTAVWVPLVFPKEDRVRNAAQKQWYLQTVARLKAGVSLDQARSHWTRSPPRCAMRIHSGTRACISGCVLSSITGWARAPSHGS